MRINPGLYLHLNPAFVELYGTFIYILFNVNRTIENSQRDAVNGGIKKLLWLKPPLQIYSPASGLSELVWPVVAVIKLIIDIQINYYFSAKNAKNEFSSSDQCDQIGRFIGLWATFKSLWQQLICPNLPHS